MNNGTNDLKKFLEKNYMRKGGADTMSIAIRDLLTDLLHIGRELNVDIPTRLNDAGEVFEEEILEQK